MSGSQVGAHKGQWGCIIAVTCNEKEVQKLAVEAAAQAQEEAATLADGQVTLEHIDGEREVIESQAEATELAVPVTQTEAIKSRSILEYHISLDTNRTSGDQTVCVNQADCTLPLYIYQGKYHEETCVCTPPSCKPSPVPATLALPQPNIFIASGCMYVTAMGCDP